jgi:hypothetical protein
MPQVINNFSTTPNSGGILGRAKPRPHYPEVGAKVRNVGHNLNRNQNLEVSVCENFDPSKWGGNQREPGAQYRCTTTYLVGATSKASYFKAITCGRDWCADCGANHSTTHRRRIDPIFPRLRTAQQMGKSIGYLVITVPKELREKFLNQEVLKDFRRYWKDKLTREGFKYGIIRYHWAGEDGYRWHPHLNILFPAGFITEETLYRWRAELSKWFSTYFQLKPERIWNQVTKKKERKFPASNLYYHYLKPSADNAESKLYHWVKYVLRATQTQPNKSTLKIINKFRNTSVFGKKKDWPETLRKEEEILAKARAGYEINEETGEVEKIVWLKTLNNNTGKLEPKRVAAPHIYFIGAENLGPGFFRLFHRVIPANYKAPPTPPPPSRPQWLDKPKPPSSPQAPEKIFCPF